MDLKATLHNLTSCSQTPIEAVSISVPGAVDSDQGIIGGYSAIPYIHKIHFVAELEELLENLSSWKMMPIVQG